MRVRLWIFAGMGPAPVIEFELPAGLKLVPEVLSWNGRTFKLMDGTQPADPAVTPIDYKEVFCLEVRS